MLAVGTICSSQRHLSTVHTWTDDSFLLRGSNFNSYEISPPVLTVRLRTFRTYLFGSYRNKKNQQLKAWNCLTSLSSFFLLFCSACSAQYFHSLYVYGSGSEWREKEVLRIVASAGNLICFLTLGDKNLALLLPNAWQQRRYEYLLEVFGDYAKRFHKKSYYFK